MKVPVDWIGSLWGSAGALILAFNVSWSGWGWCAFLVSNIAWIVYAWRTHQRSLLYQQAVFTATTLVGIWNWLL